MSGPEKEESISLDSYKNELSDDLVLKEENPIAEFIDTSTTPVDSEIKSENISIDGSLADTIAELMDQDPLKVPECLVKEELKEEQDKIDIKEEIFE